MKYYSTNETDPAERRMIRIHTDADESSREWFFAKAEVRRGDSLWYDHGNSDLQIEIFHSGYMARCDEQGVRYPPKCSTCGREWTEAHSTGDHGMRIH